jgi:ribosome-binding protein aMBF1 (putative translation factor)
MKICESCGDEFNEDELKPLKYEGLEVLMCNECSLELEYEDSYFENVSFFSEV